MQTALETVKLPTYVDRQYFDMIAARAKVKEMRPDIEFRDDSMIAEIMVRAILSLTRMSAESFVSSPQAEAEATAEAATVKTARAATGPAAKVRSKGSKVSLGRPRSHARYAYLQSPVLPPGTGASSSRRNLRARAHLP